MSGYHGRERDNGAQDYNRRGDHGRDSRDERYNARGGRNDNRDRLGNRDQERRRSRSPGRDGREFRRGDYGRFILFHIKPNSILHMLTTDRRCQQL